MMGLAERTRIKRPVLDSSPSMKERAKFLINVHYTNLYGIEIRHESVRSIRLKINVLDRYIESSQEKSIREALANQRRDFERICMLLEILM